MKQRFTHYLTLLLCAMLLWGCGAGAVSSAVVAQPELEDEQTAEDLEAHTTQDAVLRVGYFAREGHNPYLSPNQYLRQTASLLFWNFVDIGPDMALRYGAASAVVAVEDDIIITLRPGVQFSTGEMATGADMAASLLAAMESEAYAARFENVAAVSYEDDIVTVALHSPDPLFAYLLDIPLLQAEEVASRTPLAASGRFFYSEAGHELLPNSCYKGDAVAIERVVLRDVAGYDELLAALGAGEIDLFAGEAEGVEASGTVALQTEYPLNHLVFLGFNRENEALASPAVRAAIAGLADREKMSTDAYAQRAYAATGLFNPLYGLAEGLYSKSAEDTAANTLAAALQEAGYTRAGGGYTGAEGESLELTLLVYTGSAGKWAVANQLAEALRTAGVDVLLDGETDFAQYTAKIAEGDFALYIGEVKLYNNMDFSRLFTAEEYGVAVDDDGALAESWAGWQEGGTTAAALQNAFAAETPFVPLVWRTGTVYHTKRVGGFSASVSDMLFEADEISFSA